MSSRTTAATSGHGSNVPSARIAAMLWATQHNANREQHSCAERICLSGVQHSALAK
jgi:transketolase